MGESSTPLVVVGGAELDIKYLDGREERVKVRQLTVKSMDRYLEVFADESAAIELFCEKEKGWADRLSPESFDALIEKAEALNLPLFRNWYRRLTARSDIMNPGLVERAQKAASAAIEASVSRVTRSASTTSAPSSESDAG